ncbi:MAG: hypothetical protein C0592_06255 [Marinilabiliales bacterium]|nr:MAG: hypothetical protein C0592_06255 [Marinilabiliales bacterium]
MKTISVLIAILACINLFGQTLVYETGEGTTDPWSGWVADSSANCTSANVAAGNYWSFLFSTTTNDFFTARIVKEIDLVSYSSLKFVYKLNWSASYCNYQVLVSNDSVSWTVVAEDLYLVSNPLIDSVVFSQPVRYITISAEAEQTNQSIPFGEIVFSYLKVYDVSTTEVAEREMSKKEIIKITDFSGRETKYSPNTPLVYWYSDGTSKTIYRIE